MDSSLLNSFHDDPFDGEYSDNTGYWSSSNESMRQLTETLNGILPIAATEVVQEIYDNIKDDFQLQNKDVATSAASQLHNNNMLIYDHFTDQQITVGESVEIITIDPNEDYSDSEEEGNDEEGEEENYDITGIGSYLDEDGVEIPLGYIKFEDDDDNHSQHSSATFRTRTDSSSIGDYESHSSDYDDDDDNGCVAKIKIKEEHNESDEEVNLNSSFLEAHNNILFDSGFKLPLGEREVINKSRTNTYNSDIDGLGMNIDANNFDLADFITKDDFALVAATAATTVTTTQKTLAVTPPIVIPTKTLVPPMLQTKASITPNNLTTPVVQIINSEDADSDCDSDVIVDVETVEIDAKEMVNNLRRAPVAKKVLPEEAPYVDNIKDDPSWSPNQGTKKSEVITKETKLQQQQSTATALANSQQSVARNFSVVPSKKQCDFLKGKFGSGRRKIQIKERTTKNTSKRTGANKTEKPENKPSARKIGLGQGGKNLALLKQEAQKCADEQSASENDASSPVKKIVPKPIQKPITPALLLQSPIKPVSVSPIKTISVKRKLNLEEYKQRRCGGEPITKNIKIENNSAIKLEMTTKALLQPPPTTKTPPSTIATGKHSEAVTSIVKTLKEQQQMKQAQQLLQKSNVADPITEAKNKVLRMQQLKKAQQLKIIDSKISAKVPRVTKLPSLREIVKDTYWAQQEEISTDSVTHPDYEEIITVSVRSNTDVSIPPVSTLDAIALRHVKKVSRSLLKSSAVIYNTTTNNENVKISNQSLIASIQDVVVKKSLTNGGAVADIEEIATEKGHHGEDKTITHLPKDRTRNRTATVETQTDFQAAFPPLPLPPPPSTTTSSATSSNSSSRRERDSRNRNYRSSKRNSSEHSNDDSVAIDSDTDLTPPSARQRASPVPSYRSRSRSRSADSCYSNANTIDRLRHSGDTTGGYSSRSSRRHRSSISSSYSESERISRQRQRKSSYKMRTKKYSHSSSTSSSSSSDRSRTRSRSPHYRRSRSRSCSRRRSNAYNGSSNNYNSDRNVSKPAVEERRIVYVGRIEQETTKEMLRRKFLAYGNIKQITIHHKETGMKYGFVTYERSQDAFTVIDTSARDSTINMYDISFGGRRAFCRSSYADLDNAGINTYQSYVFPKAVVPPKEEDSFEALLLKVKAKMNANKPSPAPATNSANEI